MLLFTYLNNRVRRHINNATRAAGWVASESLHRCCFSPCQGELKPSRRIPGQGRAIWCHFPEQRYDSGVYYSSPLLMWSLPVYAVQTTHCLFLSMCNFVYLLFRRISANPFFASRHRPFLPAEKAGGQKCGEGSQVPCIRSPDVVHGH